MAKVKFLRGSSSDLDSATKVDGQMLLAKNGNDVNMYYDFLDNGTAKRVMVGAAEERRIGSLEDTVNGTASTDGLTDRVTDLEDGFIKVTGEVDGSSLSITDNAITSAAIIDGPYLEDITMAYSSVTVSDATHTITYTFTNGAADGVSAYVLIWK